MMFDDGVASGDVTTRSVVLWTRVAPRAGVTWQVWLSGVLMLDGEASADAEGFVHVSVTGLEPGASWRYRFGVPGEWSTWGAFRTLPESGRVRFAVVSCAKYNSGFFNAYAAIAQRDDLDFVLHLGDYIYEAAQVPRGRQTPGIDIGRPFDPPHDCVSREDYERRYAQYRQDPDLRALHEAHAMVFTLDDHEIADNAWSGGAEEHGPEDGPWEERLGHALRAWEQWLPTMRRPSTGEDLWQILSLGDVAQLFLCDSRLNRTDPFAADGPGKSVLGERQLAQLETAAGLATTPWFVVGMPSKLLSLEAANGRAETDLVMRTLKLSDDDGAAFHDRWDSYGYERKELVRLLSAAPARAAILCGDVHFAAYSESVEDGAGLLECVTSSVTSPNFDDKMGWHHGGPSREYEAQMVDVLPELQWCDLDRHGYLVVELTADRFVCEWWGLDTVTERRADATLLYRVERSPDEVAAVPAPAAGGVASR